MPTATQHHKGATLSLLARVVRLSSMQVEDEVNDIGLSMPEFRIIGLLLGESGISQKTLARRLSVKAATLSVTIDSLEKKGYVQRIRAAHDGRIKHLRLTENVDFTHSNRILQDTEARMMKGISAKEKAAFHATLTTMANNLSALLEEHDD